MSDCLPDSFSLSLCSINGSKVASSTKGRNSGVDKYQLSSWNLLL